MSLRLGISAYGHVCFQDEISITFNRIQIPAALLSVLTWSKFDCHPILPVFDNRYYPIGSRRNMLDLKPPVSFRLNLGKSILNLATINCRFSSIERDLLLGD